MKSKYIIFNLIIFIISFASCNNIASEDDKNMIDKKKFSKEIYYFLYHQSYSENINLKSNSTFLVINNPNDVNYSILKYKTSNLEYIYYGKSGKISKVKFPTTFDSTMSYLYILMQDKVYYYHYIQQTKSHKRSCYPGYCLEARFYSNDSIYYEDCFPIDKYTLDSNSVIGKFTYEKIVQLFENTEYSN